MNPPHCEQRRPPAFQTSNRKERPQLPRQRRAPIVPNKGGWGGVGLSSVSSVQFSDRTPRLDGSIRVGFPDPNPTRMPVWQAGLPAGQPSVCKRAWPYVG